MYRLICIVRLGGSSHYAHVRNVGGGEPMTTTQQTLPTREQIEQRAYEIYLKRGGEHGSDLTDWLVAEQELMAIPTEQKRSDSREPLAASRTPQKRGTSAAV